MITSLTPRLFRDVRKDGESVLNRILFAGTPDIAVPLLKRLASEFDVAGVLTATDKAQGRSRALVPSPVKIVANDLGLPVLQFESLKAEAREAVSTLGADTLVSFAYGKIFGPKFLSLFPGGAFNVHPSALPAFRGPSPIQATIRAGLREATISFQEMSLQMDAGAVYGVSVFPLDGTETSDSLSLKVAERAAEFVPLLFRGIQEGNLRPVPQTGEASYCRMLEKDDAVLDFRASVSELHCAIRSLNPWPKARAVFVCEDGAEREIFITGVYGGFGYIDEPDRIDGASGLEDKTGSVVSVRKDRGIGVLAGDGNILWVNALQLPSKKVLDFGAFINGNPWIKNGRFA